MWVLCHIYSHYSLNRFEYCAQLLLYQPLAQSQARGPLVCDVDAIALLTFSDGFSSLLMTSEQRSPFGSVADYIDCNLKGVKGRCTSIGAMLWPKLTCAPKPIGSSGATKMFALTALRYKSSHVLERARAPQVLSRSVYPENRSTSYCRCRRNIQKKRVLNCARKVRLSGLRLADLSRVNAFLT